MFKVSFPFLHSFIFLVESSNLHFLQFWKAIAHSDPIVVALDSFINIPNLIWSKNDLNFELREKTARLTLYNYFQHLIEIFYFCYIFGIRTLQPNLVLLFLFLWLFIHTNYRCSMIVFILKYEVSEELFYHFFFFSGGSYKIHVVTPRHKQVCLYNNSSWWLILSTLKFEGSWDKKIWISFLCQGLALSRRLEGNGIIMA